MMPQDEHFDDPVLRTAVRRAWAAETAPPELRQQVTSMVASTAGVAETTAVQSSPNASPGIPAGRRPLNFNALFGLAAAAVIVLVLGLIGYRLSFVAPAAGGSGDVAMASDIATRFVQTHDDCCAAPDHHLVAGVGANDMPAIARKLRNDLGIPVLARPMDHWNFAGAGPCPVGGHETAHMLYRDGQRTLSVFSMPARDFGLVDARYTATVNGHFLAAFTRDGGLYCIVGYAPDGSVSPQQAAAIRQRLMDQFTAFSNIDAASVAVR